MGLSCYPIQDGILRLSWDEPILALVNAGEFKRRLLAQVPLRSPRLVLDLHGVETVDSAALGAILAGMRLCRERGGDLVLCGAQNRVLTVFELVRLDQVLRIFVTVDEAIAALGTAVCA